MDKQKLTIIILSSIIGLFLIAGLSFGLYNFFTGKIQPGIKGFAKRSVLIVYTAKDKNLQTIANKIHSQIGGKILPVTGSDNAKINTRKYKIIFVGTAINDRKYDPESQAFLKNNKLNGKILMPFMVYTKHEDMKYALRFHRYVPKAYNKGPLVFNVKHIVYADVHVRKWLNMTKFTRWEWR